MNRSRKRQFDQFRSNAGSVRPETASMRSSKVSESVSTVSEACVNCVNQIMADRHKKAQKQQKQKARAEFRKNYNLVNSWVDDQSNIRESMKKDALEYNARMIEQQKKMKEQEKVEDINFSSRAMKSITVAEEEMKKQLEEERKREKEYFEEIHGQYMSQLEKKDKSRFNRDKNEEKAQGLPLYNPDTTTQKLRYKQALESQMNQKRQKQAQERLKNQRKQKQILEESKRQADKYHADNYEAMKMSKEEVFDGLRNLEAEKRRKVEEDRKRKEEERMREIKEENQERSRAIKARMKEMQSYVNGLKNQLLSKEEKLRSSKLADTNFFQKLPKSTEQLQAQLELKKTCKSCHKDYPQQYISPVPKKI